MTPDEFAAKMVGKPWVRWASDFNACDCYGLVLLYYREVLGVDLGKVPETDIVSGFYGSTWVESQPIPGACGFMSFRNGIPTHCGILLSEQQVIHAEGSQDHAGSVKITSLAAMRRAYKEIVFYVPA